jgi:hypothetical protein
MNKIPATVLVTLALASVALASSLTVNFGREPTRMDSQLEGGKLYVPAEALSDAMGVRAVSNAGRVTFKLGERVSFTAPSIARDRQPYVVALEVARGLGFTATLKDTTLTLQYEKRVRCEDFKYQEDAQRFYMASSQQSEVKQADRDPYRLDKDGDGRACMSLPEAPK